MKNKLIVLIFITALLLVELNAYGTPYTVEVLNSDKSTTTINYKINDFRMTPVLIDSRVYYSLRLTGEGITHNIGEPELPYISHSIIVPDKSNTKISVVYSDFEEMTIDIVPSKGILLRDVDPDSVDYHFGDIYQEDAFSPYSLTELGDPYILRDFRGQAVRVYPFQYNPVAGILRVYREITVKVSSIDGASNNIKLREYPGYQPEFESIYKSHFINFNNHYFRYRSVRGRMIIIVYDAFAEVTIPYMNWKIQKGMPVTMHRISEIGNTAAAIKTFIQEQYNNDDGLVYVQLVGDHPQIPSFIINSGGSDPSFSLIDGEDNWLQIDAFATCLQLCLI